jgi:hypothetical protein
MEVGYALVPGPVRQRIDDDQVQLVEVDRRLPARPCSRARAAKVRNSELVMETESFLADPIGALPH